MSEKMLCGPCGYAENDKNAEKWCTVCEEGLCADCEKVHKSIKTSRKHMLISIDDFEQIQNIIVSLTCEDHGKRLELYCKTHDVAVCLGCVPSRHRTCSDVIPLDKAAENAKCSTALADLEDTLTIALQNLQQIISDRESALKNFESQKQTIKNTINETRARIQKKLDNLELKLLHDLDTTHENCKSESTKILNRMKNSKREVSCLAEQTSQLKAFASDIQLFLGTRQINEAVFKGVEYVKEGLKSVQDYETNIQLHPSFIALINEVDMLGKISVKKTTKSLPFKEIKVKQAQAQLQVPNTKSITNVRLQLKKRFKVQQEEAMRFLGGCAILSNGNLLFSVGKNVLMEYSEEGKYIRDIQCSDYPFDLTVIDSDRIAVTYQDDVINILNIKNNTTEKLPKFKNYCFGISYQDNKLVIVSMNGILITDIAGKVIKALKIECASYLGTSKNRIYFTVKSNHTVHCISMKGEEIWVHKKESLVDPRGITVDDHQNVFIVDLMSKSLVVIQHDGKSSRTLLNETNGLVSPISLHYNKDKNALILCDEDWCTLYTFCVVFLLWILLAFSLNIDQ